MTMAEAASDRVLAACHEKHAHAWADLARKSDSWRSRKAGSEQRRSARTWPGQFIG